MVVQHNMQAANANRMLGITVNSQQKSTEKLSSGYRINRAADDAAGLAISEKMRSQIRGLDRASTNAQDGISVVQTAEGALNEVHDMLQRMNELATQAANDTNTSQDRSQIQVEIDQLTSEINRVQSTTQFNTMNLLDGTFKSKNLQVGSLSGQRITIDIDNMDAESLGVSRIKTATEDISQANASATKATGSKKTDAGLTAAVTTAPTVTGVVDGDEFTFDGSKWNKSAGTGTLTELAVTANTGYGFEKGAIITFSGGTAWANASLSTNGAYKTEQLTKDDVTVANDAKGGVYTYTNGAWVDSNGKAAVGVSDKVSTKYVEGATVTVKGKTDAIDKGKKYIEDGFGGKTLADETSSVGLKVDSHDNAGKAMDAYQKAIDKVSTQRANLGAIQNRLEHTIKNLDTTSENTQAAESRIRDTDMAKEMVTWSKNNILAQAGQSMLAQANQSNQGVLSLLQ